MVAWSAATQAACGFTMGFAFLYGGIAYAFGYLPPAAMNAMGDAVYLAIVLPIIGSGLAITIESWKSFIQQRSLSGGLLVAWNTYAQIRNTYQAVQGIGSAWRGLTSALGESDDDIQVTAVRIALILAAVALLSGVLLTRGIVLHYAGQKPLLTGPAGGSSWPSAQSDEFSGFRPGSPWRR